MERQNQAAIERLVAMVMSGKGGVGKTLVCSTLNEWYRFQGLPPLLLDCDDNGSLRRTCPAAQPFVAKGTVEVAADGIVELSNVHAEQTYKELFAKLLDAEVTLADLPANATWELCNIIRSIKLRPAFQSMNGRLLFLLVVQARDSAAVAELLRRIQVVRRDVDWAVVLNERLGKDFSDFHGSPAWAALTTMGCREVRFPQIPPTVQAVLDRDGMTLPVYLGKTVASQPEDRVSLFRKAVVGHDAYAPLKAAFSAFNTLAPLLLPTARPGSIKDPSVGLREFCAQRWQEFQAAAAKPENL